MKHESILYKPTLAELSATGLSDDPMSRAREIKECILRALTIGGLLSREPLQYKELRRYVTKDDPKFKLLYDAFKRTFRMATFIEFVPVQSDMDSEITDMKMDFFERRGKKPILGIRVIIVEGNPSVSFCE